MSEDPTNMTPEELDQFLRERNAVLRIVDGVFCMVNREDLPTTAKYVKKEVPGSEEIQKMGDELLAKAADSKRWQNWAEKSKADLELLKAVKQRGLTLEDLSRSNTIDIGAELNAQLKEYGLKLTFLDGHPVLTKIEE